MSDRPRISRPCSLVLAAEAVAARYRREKHLPRLGPDDGRPLPDRLAAAERAAEAARRARLPGYSAARHVSLLGALMAETADAEATIPGRIK